MCRGESKWFFSSAQIVREMIIGKMRIWLWDRMRFVLSYLENMDKTVVINIDTKTWLVRFAPVVIYVLVCMSCG